MDQGVFRRGLSEQAIDADPSPESGTVSPLTRPPAWKSLAGNSHFQRLNEEGIRAEQAMVRQSQQDSPRASTARQPRWKSGIGTLQREFPDGSIEDHDPEALLDDPEVGPLAAQSLYLRDVKAAQDDEAATRLRLDDPADQRKLADKKREEILSIGAGLAESDPEHQKLKKQLIDHDARVKEEQELYQKRVRLQQIKQGGVSGWFQQRQQAKPIEQKAQEASQQAQANTARIIAAEKSAALEEEQLSQQAQQGVRGNDLPAFQQRQQELAAAKAQIAEQKAQAMEPVKAVQAEAQAKEKDFFNTGDTISGIWDAVKGLGTSAPAAFYQLTEGMNRPDQYSDSAKKAFAEADAFNKEMQAKTDANQKAGISSSVGESFREAGGSLGFSLGSMAAAIPAGMAGSAAGEAIGGTIGGVIGGIAGAPAAGVGAVPAAAGGATLGATIGGFIGGTAASMAASGTAAYRMAGASFLNESFQQIEAESMRKNGRPMNEEEKQSAYDALLPIAKNTALWEAGPEAVGNAVTLGAGKIIFGLGTSLAEKFGVGALAKAVSKGTLTAAQQAEVAALKGSQKLAYEATRAGSTVSGKVAIGAADLGVELGTETVTQVEQSADQKKAQAIAQWQDPSAIKADWSTGGVVEAFKEVAPQTLALMGLMGGAGGALKLASKATGIGAAKPGNPPATEIDIKPNVDNALIAIDPQNALAEREEINKAALISRPTDGPSEIADAVLIERELSVIEQEDADFTASSEQAVLDATTSGDKATIKAAEAARDSFRPNRAATTRAVLKVASGQSLVNLTTSELDALGLQAKEGKPDKAGNVRIEFTEKPVPKGQSNRPKMIRMGEDGSSVLTDEALKVVSEASPRARARVKLTETEALQKAKARAASTPWTVTGAAGTSVKVQAKTREEAERMAVGMPQWKLGETVKTAIEGTNSQSAPNSSEVGSNEQPVPESVQKDLEEAAYNDAADWDRSTKQQGRNRSDEWFEGGNANMEAIRGYQEAQTNGGSQLQAHGMAKEATLSGGVRNLLGLLRNGLDMNRRGGRLDTASLVATDPNASGGATASGAAYKDGPFTLIARPGQGLSGDLSGLGAVVINQANAAQAESIRKAIHAVRPDVIVGTASELGSITKQLLSQTAAPAAAASDPATLKRKITKAIAERKKGTTIPIDIHDGLHANATEAGVQVNPSRLADMAAKAGFSEDQTGEWIASVIDEEIRHVAHLRAARAVFKKAGSPGGDFEAWRDSHYGEMWKGEFTAEQKADIATLYGEAFDGLKDWQKAMEGLRMLSQQLATGSPTESARLWKKLSQSIRDHITAALASLKAMTTSLSPALKAEVDALEAFLSQYVTQPPATPDRSQKPAQVKTPVRDGAAGKPSGKADSDGGAVVGGRADLPSVGDRVRIAFGIEGVVVGIADDKKKALIKTDTGNRLLPIGEMEVLKDKPTDTKSAEKPASPVTAGKTEDIQADTINPRDRNQFPGTDYPVPPNVIAFQPRGLDTEPLTDRVWTFPYDGTAEDASKVGAMAFSDLDARFDNMSQRESVIIASGPDGMAKFRLRMDSVGGKVKVTTIGKKATQPETSPPAISDSAPKPKQAKKPRKISRNLPRNVEMFREDPLVAKLMEIGKIMSKSRALKVMGREWFKQNASLYNDAPTLSPAFVSSIYSDTATLAPDQMATYLADAGQGDGTVNGFWQAIGDAANSAAQTNKQTGIEEKRQTEAERQLVNFEKSNVEGTNTVPINAGDLEVGNTVVVDGEEMTVKAVEDDGSVVLDDGSKFGRQTINGNETVWAEMDDSPFLSDEDLEPAAEWLVDQAVEMGYTSVDELAVQDPERFDGLVADTEIDGQGTQEAGPVGSLPEGGSEATGGEGQVKRPASKMDIRNADSKELFADDGGFKLGQDTTVDGDKVATDRKAKEDAKAAQDAAQGDMFGAPALTEAEQALKDAFGDMVDGLNAADISIDEYGELPVEPPSTAFERTAVRIKESGRTTSILRQEGLFDQIFEEEQAKDDAYESELKKWLDRVPQNQPITFQSKDSEGLPNYKVVTRNSTNPEKPWRTTTWVTLKRPDWTAEEEIEYEDLFKKTRWYSNSPEYQKWDDRLRELGSRPVPEGSTRLVPYGHEEFKSRFDALNEARKWSRTDNPQPKIGALFAADISDSETTYTQGIPPEKIGQFITAAQKLIADGVKTPSGLASALDKISPKLRAYSDAVWSAFRMVDPSLQASPDWAGVYESLAPKVEDQADFQTEKAQVITAIAADVRDALLRGEKLTVDQIKAKNPRNSTLSRKDLDETIEAGITAAAHRIAKGQDSESVKFQRLVTLYQNQPSLNAKTSTSKINQAYSTPAPMAYVASRLADIARGKVLDEPTGGHGMLMMEARPDQTVEFNEIDANRRERTKLAIGGSENWRMTGEDATSWTPSEAPDRIASNPPFGSVMAEDGSNIAWITAAGKTTAIDHAIMLKQLASMTPDGRAVFIIGGPAKTARSEASRKEYYGKGSKAAFFKYLHDNYGVVDHFTVDGDMYAKQGAGWNVDVITIQGKKPSRTALPSAKSPRMISSWADLFETTQLTDEQRIQLNRLSEEEVRDSVRGMVDALAGIGNVGRPQATGARNEPGSGQDGAGGNSDSATSSESPSTERFSNEERGAVDGGRDAGAESESAGVDAGSKPDGENTGTRGPSERSSDSTGAVRNPVKESGKFQAEYTPFSGEKGLDTLLPKNMVGPVASAFERIKKDLGGNLTKFVHEKLGYPAGTDITKYLAGEQIDAVAAAIWNFERGGALIIGDQTGIGKGRIAAALMKYAVNQGYIPVFMTKDPGLHDAMLTEDLPDIASPEIIPAVMDTKLQFDSAKKRKLNYGEEYFAQAASTGALPGDANAIFVTYSQITADDAPGLTKADRASARNAGEAPADKWRMRALRLLAPNAVFILDESHLASGQSTTGWRVADILRRSSRVYYSSATSVKRPENMGIYFKTNVGMLTGGNMAELTELMNTGGVPAMQVVSSMLAQDGQYLRRERSFDGVKFITQISEETADRDRELADGLTGSLRHIVTVQDAMRQAAEAINAVIANAGKRMQVPAANRAKLETVNFSSKLHNIVGQYLLAIKTQSAADTAIREIRAGKKVVVAVQSTMESAIDGLEFGGFEMSYKGLVLRYLDQMRFLTSGNKAFGRGEVETFEVKEDGLPEFDDMTSQDLERRIVSTSTDPGTGDTVILINEKVAAELMRRSMWDVFARSRDAIESIDLGNLPISPIDAMRQAVEQAGIRTGEITGRKRGIDTNGEIYVRPTADTAKPARRVAQAAFNNEDLDFLVINQSGSTGISLHASEKAKNQATRVMVVAQPNLDINEFMQTLGRIHRSGQVVSPEFILLQTALPAEKRPAAILGKKMSMLNANTTSNAKTDVSEGNTAIDIFNQYGDEMAYKVLERDKDLQDQLRPLGSSLAKFFNKETGALVPYQDAQQEVNEQPDGYIARTITGYLAILPVEEQEIFWEKTLADYQAFISYLDQIGQNALEAKALDLQAKTTASEVFTEKAEGDSAFSAPSYIETVETKVGRAPLTGEKAVELSVSAKAGSKAILQAYLANADAAANDLADKKSKRAIKAWDGEKRSEFLANQRAQRNVIASAISLVGRFGNVKRNDGNAGIGVIEEIRMDEANPLTPSKQIAVIRVNDSRETLRVPVTQLSEAFTPDPSESAKEWDDTTDVGGESAIATGNLMAAMKALGGAGKVITYTTDSGVDKMGILLPKSFLTKRAAIKSRTQIDTAEKLLAILDAGLPVTNSDGSIKWTKGNSIATLSVPASRARGGDIWRNPMLNRTALSGEFTQIGNDMRATYYLKDVPAVFKFLTDAGETFSSAKADGGQSLQAADISGESNGQEPFNKSGSQQNEADRIPSRAEVARSGKSQGSGRGAKEIAIEVFGGKNAGGSEYLSEGAESLVERVGKDWVIKTIADKGVFVYTQEGKLSRSNEFEDVRTKARIINILGGFETHAVEIDGKSYLIQRHGNGFVSEDDLDGVRLPFNLQPNQVNRVEMDGDTYLVSDLHTGNFRKDDNGKIRVIDLIASKVSPQVSLLDGVDDSLLAADLSDNETLPNIADLREKGRATMAGPEVEAEIRAQQAAFKQQGKVAGRPDLANISEDEDVRAEMDVTDEMRKWVAQRQEKQQWENEGRRLVETDADAVEEKILEAAYTRGGQKFTAADVVAGRILAEKRTKEAGNDKQKHADAAVLRHGYREVRSEQARVLAAGTDPFKTPEERHRDFIAGALYELPQSLLNDIEGRSQSPAQARAAIRKAVIERLTKIEKALKKMGVTLDEITSGQVSLSLAKEKVMKDAIAKLSQAEKLAVAAIQKGGALPDIRKLTGLSDSKIQELNTRIRLELRDKIRAKVQAGMKLEDLKGKLDGLRAASMLSDEEVNAEVERILAVGFGMPAEVPSVRKSVKRAKVKIVAPIDANWNRPEFTDGLDSYTFNTADRAEIMRKVATLRDLAGVEGKVAGLTGDKKAKGVRLIAEINSILSKYDTSVETILREGKDIADYRFDMSDRNHVMVVARTINAIDADLLDKGSEYYYASILSGLQTMMVNATTIVPSVWDMTIGRGFEMATNLLFRDPMATSFGEVKYILKAAGPFLTRAWTNAAAAWGTEMPFFEEDVLGKTPDLDAIFESRGIYRTGSIGGNLGRLIRTPTRLLLATDEFVRTANACMEVGAMAYRLARREGLTPGTPKFDTFLKQQVNLPGSPAWQLAAKKAADRIFAAPLPTQTDITTGKAVPIRDIGDVVGAGAAQIGKFLNQKTDSLAAKSTLLALRLLFFPFQKVPFNIVRQAARRTLNPISLVDIGVLIGRNLRVQDGKWTLNANGGKAEIAERLAQQAQGALLVMLLAATGAGEGDDKDLDKPILITGSRPYGETKKGDRELGYRLGLGPYEFSVKMPNGQRKGFSYGRLEPAATVLGATVDTMRELAMYRQGKQSLGEAGGKIIGALRSQLTEKTFLRGFSDAQQIASGDSDLSRFTAERLAVIMPNIIRQPLREADPNFRERKDGFVDNLSAALWPYGQGEIKHDLYGEPLEKKGNSVSRIIDFTDFGGDQAQPFDEMLWRYRQMHPQDSYAPQSPAPNYTDPLTKKPATMTPAQLAKYKEISGQKILSLTKRESFNLKNPTESDIKRFKAVVDDGREFARLMLFKSPAWRNLK
jgi:hypothetical protein